MIPAASSHSNGSSSEARLPPRTTSEYLNFFVDERSSCFGILVQILFAAAALIGLSGVHLILIIAGSVLVVGGAVMMILQATGVVRLGKGAKA